MYAAITGDRQRCARGRSHLRGAAMTDGVHPCSAYEAVQRARLLLAAKSGQYVLGTGDYHPAALDDSPWTTNHGMTGSDCAGFAICWCYKLRRHRPGFNVGPWASVANDINCNSAIEDALHTREVFELATRPEPGDLVAYPSFTILAADGERHPFVGHVGLVSGVSRVAEWDPATPQYGLLDIIHCCGPNARSPAAVATDGHIWQHHDQIWPKPQHRSYLLRVRSGITP